MTELVLLTMAMEANKGWEVIAADILGAFVQRDKDEVFHMVLH